MESNDQYIKVLKAFSALPHTTRIPTIFEIGGFPHYENAISNILAFYLDPRREHGLGASILDAILGVVREPPLDAITGVEIRREFSTKNKGRIDLLIHTPSVVVCIENKITAGLTNDLEDYWETIQNIAGSSRRVIGIVLSVNQIALPPMSRFKGVLYSQLWEEVRNRLGAQIDGQHFKWSHYLKDLMETTTNLGSSEFELTEQDKFIISNTVLVEQLVRERNSFLDKLYWRLSQLQDMLDKGITKQFDKQAIWARETLFHEIKLGEHTIVLDLNISPTGWVLQIFERKNPSQDFLEPLLAGKRFKIMEKSQDFDEKRFLLKEWRLETDLSEISRELERWLRWAVAQKR